MIESKERQVDKLYTEYGYPRELREEYTDDTFRFSMEVRDNQIMLTHWVKKRALFREYFDVERKLWVYEKLDNPSGPARE